jgi:flavin reductase (DIM6/NTAB) family NADH-FMN oxidoreductase RutF
VAHTLELGSHTVFIGEVVGTYVQEEITGEKGSIDFNKCSLLGFCAGRYLGTAPLDQSIGFSQKK